jgi:hypothetical protein
MLDIRHNPVSSILEVPLSLLIPPRGCDWPTRYGRQIVIGFFSLGLLLLSANQGQSEDGGVAIELNKLEPKDQGCRVYLVTTNKGAELQTLKLDMILFQTDGVIGRRFSIDLSPLKAGKRVVRLFDIDDSSCDQIGSFLINEALDCKTASGPLEDCLANITTSSLAKAQLSK